MAALVAALALYLCIGHAAHAPVAMEAAGKVAHGAGICLLIGALLVPLALPAVPVWRAPGLPPQPAPIAILLPTAAPAQARASPAWLQRFLD